MPVITLPDGTKKTFDSPVTVAQVAASIGAGLAKAAIAGKVDDKLVDTFYTINSDANLRLSLSLRHESLGWFEDRGSARVISGRASDPCQPEYHFRPATSPCSSVSSETVIL